MITFALLCVLSVSAQSNLNSIIKNVFTTPKEQDFQDLYEEVTTPGLGRLIAITPCGEGADEGVHRCVPYHNCDSLGRLIQNSTGSEPQVKSNNNGFGIIDIRFGRNSCKHPLEVCCDVTGNFSTSTTTSTTPSSDDLGSRKFPRPTTTTRAPVTTTGCGVRNNNGIDFKITGNRNNEAEYGEFPWMVALIRKDEGGAQDGGFSFCGGSLIRQNVVLTAAHCANRYKADNIKVRVGEWDSETERERVPYQEQNVRRIIKHEEFDSGVAYNDIALLILEQPVRLAENVGTICLPSERRGAEFSQCVAHGWGKNVFGEKGQFQNILKKIELPIVPRDECQRLLRRTRLGNTFELHDSFICAGGAEGRDTCTGDGGSPLVCPNPERPNTYVQVGIVAWGIGCGQRGIPGVYADVVKLRGWIDQKLKENSL